MVALGSCQMDRKNLRVHFLKICIFQDSVPPTLRILDNYFPITRQSLGLFLQLSASYLGYIMNTNVNMRGKCGVVNSSVLLSTYILTYPY